MKVINFRNNVQAALFTAELSGQISDGMWENTRPHDHWKSWCSADVQVNPTNVGVNFYSPKNNYNFSSKMLLDIVGQRMIWAANLAEAGFDPKTVCEFYDTGDYILTQPHEYYKNLVIKLKEKFGSFENLVFARENGTYDMKKLKAELNDMKAIIKKTITHI